MLYERLYMRKSQFDNSRSFVDKFIIILISIFILQSFVELFSSTYVRLIYQLFAFSTESLFSLLLWTPITYVFFHDGPIHLIMNLLGLYFIGRSVENLIGSVNFYYLCILGSVFGSLNWLFFNSLGSSLIGSSAIVMACLTYFCLKKPDDEITLLLFFVLPCRLKPRWILLGVLSIEVYGFIFSELSQSTGIAHSAHLGGMIGGSFVFLYLQSGKEFPHFTFIKSPKSSKTKNFKPSIKFSNKKVSKVNYKVNISNPVDLQREVDRILDKINDKGFGSLTQEEKLTLEKAKGFL